MAAVESRAPTTANADKTATVTEVTASEARPPPLTQSDAITSLLSLSIAAAAASSIPVSTTSSNSTPTPVPVSNLTATAPSSIPISTTSFAAGVGLLTNTSTNATGTSLTKLGTSLGKHHSHQHHRRLGSTGQTRRRLSDAREASTRLVLATSPGSSGSNGLSLASLSLSASPPPNGAGHHGHSQSLGSSAATMAAIGHLHPYSSTYSPLAPKPAAGTDGKTAAVPIKIVSSNGHKSSSSISASVPPPSTSTNSTFASVSASTASNGKAKKRSGVDYKCESCAKIYRHPNCLNKHRWEHTSQWREASKFVLSKHQQVQLLEAAAILSFMGVNSKDDGDDGKALSLPEDRSEWPSFLMGGRLPKVGALKEEEEREDVEREEREQTEREEMERHRGIVIGNGTSGVAGSMPAFGTIGRAHGPSTVTTSTRTYALQPQSVTVTAHSGHGVISASVPNSSTISQGPRMYNYAVGSRPTTHVAPGLVGVPNPAPPTSDSSSRSRSRSISASASNSNGSDVEVHGDRDIEVDIVGEDVDIDEVDGMSLDGDSEERVKDTKPFVNANAANAFAYSPSYNQQQQAGAMFGQSPGGGYSPAGVPAYDTFGSYGSYGSAASYSYGNGNYVSTTPSSAYGGGYTSSSYTRRHSQSGSLGIGVGLKREEDEMSVGFSVREEDEEDEEERGARYAREEEEEGDAEDAKDDDTIGIKRFGAISSLRATSVSMKSSTSSTTRKSSRKVSLSLSSRTAPIATTRSMTTRARGRASAGNMETVENKWDGMEMEVDNMDMD